MSTPFMFRLGSTLRTPIPRPMRLRETDLVAASLDLPTPALLAGHVVAGEDDCLPPFLARVGGRDTLYVEVVEAQGADYVRCLVGVPIGVGYEVADGVPGGDFFCCPAGRGAELVRGGAWGWICSTAAAGGWAVCSGGCCCWEVWDGGVWLWLWRGLLGRLGCFVLGRVLVCLGFLGSGLLCFLVAARHGSISESQVVVVRESTGSSRNSWFGDRAVE
ncbi:hypothetical protein B0T19DRAFT_413676 [Cercophora scortea]|uniref:Uncharacterized protein n=1 Tax=Cercophora scortea TaxID=314031 RepID=A0AAE0IVC4_9PEZI|nr:hypothetical protein B0T19DRAFT_413676 [Cercophora scortea]